MEAVKFFHDEVTTHFVGAELYCSPETTIMKIIVDDESLVLFHLRLSEFIEDPLGVRHIACGIVDRSGKPIHDKLVLPSLKDRMLYP